MSDKPQAQEQEHARRIPVGDDWSEWRQHVLHELARLSAVITAQAALQSEMRAEIRGLREKASMWGAVWGALCGAALSYIVASIQ